jgi:hypothetical protein
MLAVDPRAMNTATATAALVAWVRSLLMAPATVPHPGVRPEPASGLDITTLSK